MLFLVAKVVHFVGLISWFAGLFYIVRLFIYHAEAGQRENPDERRVLQAQLEMMAGRLWKIITVPAAVLTFAGGLTMVFTLLQLGGGLAGWLHVKFGFLAALVLYMVQCGRIRRQQLARTCDWSSTRLRVFNEVATLLMVAIVSLAVIKSSMSALWGMVAMLGLGISLMLGIRAYARIRRMGPTPSTAASPE